MVASLKAAIRRWPSGHNLLWYPIKDRPAARAFLEAVVATGIAKILLAQMQIKPAGPLPSLDGAAMLIVNPPWRVEADLAELLPALARCLGQYRGARATIEWLAPEGRAT
jgi:23S rRNA (adenine2030-N6)-methyltransferase